MRGRMGLVMSAYGRILLRCPRDYEIAVGKVGRVGVRLSHGRYFVCGARGA